MRYLDEKQIDVLTSTRSILAEVFAIFFKWKVIMIIEADRHSMYDSES